MTNLNTSQDWARLISEDAARISALVSDGVSFWGLTPGDRFYLLLQEGAIGRCAQARFALDFSERCNQLSELKDKNYVMKFAKKIFDVARCGFMSGGSKTLELLLYHGYIKSEWLSGLDYCDWLNLAMSGGYDIQVLSTLIESINFEYLDDQFFERSIFAGQTQLEKIVKEKRKIFDAQQTIDKSRQENQGG